VCPLDDVTVEPGLEPLAVGAAEAPKHLLLQREDDDPPGRLLS
jgi:hypothetical protein